MPDMFNIQENLANILWSHVLRKLTYEQQTMSHMDRTFLDPAAFFKLVLILSLKRKVHVAAFYTLKSLDCVRKIKIYLFSAF